jgi:transposase-like protein
MRQASKRVPESAEKTVRDIRRATRRHHSAEGKIRIVLEGVRGEDSIAELCRKEGINQINRSIKADLESPSHRSMERKRFSDPTVPMA